MDWRDDSSDWRVDNSDSSCWSSVELLALAEDNVGDVVLERRRRRWREETPSRRKRREVKRRRGFMVALYCCEA